MIYENLGAEEILRDEQRKKPCAKFPNGMCQFGAMCRFSHYTPVEMAKIKEKGNNPNQYILKQVKILINIIFIE